MATRIALEVDGRPVEVDDDGASLLEVLRDRLGIGGPKDGCSPQGQCGCCTVLVDGAPRVACVTPVRRVAGRRITTVDGLPAEERTAWADALVATGGSQCGFCTPGIVCRLAAAKPVGRAAVDRALAAHLCRCTGWQTIVEAAAHLGVPGPARDLE
ncbi:MAG: putative oxidoreductase, partial [Actinomycetia bacterium]|nr:putative oxidoreductase [Actinomycetes bacterium]